MKQSNEIYKGILLMIDEETKSMKVRVPVIHGGTIDPDRTVDERLPWIKSIWIPDIETIDEGKYKVPKNRTVVLVAYDDGGYGSLVVLGRFWS